MRKLIIAVDYDETIVLNNAYGEEQGVNTDLVTKLIVAKNSGHSIILWTCREGDWLKTAVERCKVLGLEFDAVNENVKNFETKNVGKRKIVADIYIDDRAVLPQNFKL